jgi:glycosyltransferase involved in cell wall biosynthesis
LDLDDHSRTIERGAAGVGQSRNGAAVPRVLVLLQNTAVPGDRRVGHEIETLRSADYEVVIVCPQRDGPRSEARPEPDGVTIHRFPQPEARGTVLSYLREYAAAYWRIRRLARRLSKERPFDVVLAANPPDFLLMAVRSLKRRGSWLIFDHHDLWPELYLARFGSKRSPLYWLIVAIERVNFRLADFVLATNESYKRIAVDRGRKRPKDVFVVRNGPVLADFLPVPADPTLKRGRPHLIGYIGEMARQDGIDHALRALAHLREWRDDWRAVFAGDGEAESELRRLASELGLDDRVEFCGWLDDAEIRKLLCSSDLCLVPDPRTTLSDVSTLAKIAEYMAMSRPIVAFDLTESRVTAGDAALYARPNDEGDFARAISELLDDPERRDRMGKIGRRRVEDGLSWEHSEPVLLSAFRAALARTQLACL